MKNDGLKVEQKNKATNVVSVIRAINIIKSISKGNGKISQIANTVDLTKGTTHRLLATLIRTRFVVQDPISLEYSLGPALLGLLYSPEVTHKNLVTCAFEEMKALNELTGETIVLHIISGLERVCIACIESSHSIRYTNAVGLVTPLYLGGAGKILLSELDGSELSIILNNIDFTPLTDNTITDRDKLMEEIQKVRRLGYATSFGERTEGSSCLSVPVRKYVTPVALSVLGPITRFKFEEGDGLVETVQKTAENISKQLMKSSS